MLRVKPIAISCSSSGTLTYRQPTAVPHFLHVTARYVLWARVPTSQVCTSSMCEGVSS